MVGWVAAGKVIPAPEVVVDQFYSGGDWQGQVFYQWATFSRGQKTQSSIQVFDIFTFISSAVSSAHQ